MFLESLVYELLWLKSGEYTEYRIIIFVFCPAFSLLSAFLRKLIVVRQTEWPTPRT